MVGSVCSKRAAMLNTTLQEFRNEWLVRASGNSSAHQNSPLVIGIDTIDSFVVFLQLFPLKEIFGEMQNICAELAKTKTWPGVLALLEEDGTAPPLFLAFCLLFLFLQQSNSFHIKG
jgi:hypothetical protein